ncbi:hypothetical protein QBC45DRAFT_17630 [Copromyces sp. CBS 386.78]|nr:hypothetical protein QBC45DRAFT_17630 [Copromyces sp. CBS 386.78]
MPSTFRRHLHAKFQASWPDTARLGGFGRSLTRPLAADLATSPKGSWLPGRSPASERPDFLVRFHHQSCNLPKHGRRPDSVSFSVLFCSHPWPIRAFHGSEWVLTLFDSFYIRERTAWLSSGPSNPNSKPGRHPGKCLGSLESYSGTMPTGSTASSSSPASPLPPYRSSTLSVYLKDPLSRTSRIDSCLETSLSDTMISLILPPRLLSA